MGPQKATMKIILDEINKVKNLIIEHHNKEMSVMQEGLVTELRTVFNKFSLDNNIMQDFKNEIKMVAQQNQAIQKTANEKYIMIISYEKERNEPSYCEAVLNTFISRNDIKGYEKVFSNDHKTLYQVKLASKFMVNLVLKQKSCLRGRTLYIHRPYTDIEKEIRNKQIQHAKQIAKTEGFKIVRNKLFIGDSTYEWSTETENFVVIHSENASKVIEDLVYEVKRPSISTNPNYETIVTEAEVLTKDSSSSSSLKPPNCTDADQENINKIMKLLFSMEEKCENITSSTSELTEKLDRINKKCRQQLKPP